MRGVAPCLFALVGLCFTQSSATAGSVSDALASFGLIGNWSPNCAQDPNDPNSREEGGKLPVRWTYSLEGWSSGMLTKKMRTSIGLNVSRQELQQAQKITADKIKYTTLVVSFQSGNGLEQKSRHASTTSVVQMANDKITVVSEVTGDGFIYVENGMLIIRMPKDGQLVETNRTPFGMFERCLN